MTLIDFRKYVSSGGFASFEYDQSIQPDGKDAVPLRVHMNFDKILFSLATQTIHLVCDNGSFSIGIVDHVVVTDKRPGDDPAAYFTIVRLDGVRHRICAHRKHPKG